MKRPSKSRQWIMSVIIISVICVLKLSLLAGQSPAESLQSIEIPFYSSNAQIIRHSAYVLKYSEEHEQAEWVAYKLTAGDLRGGIKRTNNFRADSSVKTGSASLSDYKGSGYDRGHLVPAADMKRSRTTMSESFYMSNMSPQRPGFNRGIWKRLEEQVRSWVYQNEELYIVTAGILQCGLTTIGPNRVSVPRFYYKAILDYREPGLKGIAFILPNKKSNNSLKAYVVSIDLLEEITGIDFFPALPDNIEENIESSLDISRWPFD
ncbi:MAG: DNA/RNA non-specific endonuclease [Spirochaetota bacterium]|nr:DNA/RNA non-specific endonuclease [Spirochaetota bacterium]